MSEGIKKKHTNDSKKEAIEVLENKQSPLQLLTPTDIMNEPISSPRVGQDMETAESDENKTVQSSIKEFFQPVNESMTPLTGQHITVSVRTGDTSFSPLAAS